MPFSRKIEERRQRRETERRERALERRREDDRRHEEDERRRDEAAAETRALELQLDADRERRLTRILQARLTRLDERRLVAERMEQRQRIVDAILQARRAAEDAAEAMRLRRGQLAEARHEDTAADRDRDEDRRDDRQVDKPEINRIPDAGSKPKRPNPPQPVESKSDLRQPRPPRAGGASTDRQRGARDDRDRPPIREGSSALRGRLRDQQRIRGEHAAAHDDRRESRRRQRDAAAAEIAQQQARRAGVREARLAERRQSAKALETIRAERDEAQRQRLVEREPRHTADRARRAERIEPLRPDLRPEPSTPRDPLTDRFASGVLSGSLPWLTTKGNRVVTITGDAVVLRGIGLIGMEGPGITDALVDEAIAWGANVVRAAIDRHLIAGADTSSGRDYLHELDTLVRRIAQAGAYTLLSLREVDDGTGGDTGSDASGTWRFVAEHYAAEPAVLFELDTAPRPSASNDLTGYRSNWELWTLWAQMTVAAVRLVHPRALCVVLGLDEGADLRGFPIPGTAGHPIPNLIYATHFTPPRSTHWPAVRALARRHPVLVTKWGGSDSDVTWGERIAQGLRAEGIGWMAMHGTAERALVRATGDQLAPTKFGVVVQRAFALSARDMVAAPAWAATP